MKKFILFTVVFAFGFISLKIFAGPSYDITFCNDSDKMVVINPVKSSHWYPKDFGIKWIMEPHTKKTLHTIAKQGKNDGIVVVSLSSGSKIFAQVAIWFGKNKKQSVDYNVSKSGWSEEYIGTNNPNVKTDFTSNSSGYSGKVTGNVYLTNNSLK